MATPLRWLRDGKQEKIRLYSINALEKGQDFGQKAGDFTSALLAGGHVEIQPKDADRYGWTVGIVLVDGQNLNELIVRNGYLGPTGNTARKGVWGRSIKRHLSWLPI